MAKSNTLSFTVPNDLKLKLDAVTHIGHYDSLSEFLRDAIRSLLNNNKHLRISIAHHLHKQKKIPLGKASEIIGDSIHDTKKLFENME
ncbi:MAG: ribbon-helix-helix domain-containing protein [Candidatus Woesearchaeota archaeon]